MHAARLQTAICWQFAALADSLQSACKVGLIAALATYLCTTFGKLYGGGTAKSLFDLLDKKYWFVWNVYRRARTRLNSSGCVLNRRNYSRAILVRCWPF